MPRPCDIMCAGHLCVDITPRFHDTGAKAIGEILRPGKLVDVHEAAISTGGSVSNTGLNMKKLGNNVAFCARVGDDVLGSLTIDLLRESGNPEGIRLVEGAASAYTVVIAPPGIDRIFLHNTGTNDTFGPEDLDPELIGQCRQFHFAYPTLMARMFADEGGELARVFQIAKEAGATTSCDLALPDPASPAGKAPWRSILEKTLPYVDIFLPSIEEMLYMLEPETFLRMKEEHGGAELIDYLPPSVFSRIAEQVLAMGCTMTTLKAGHRGFYFRSGAAEGFETMGAARPGDPANWAHRELWAPALSIGTIASATGAGDASIAGFLTAYLRGMAIEQALKAAVCCGWQNLQQLDAVSGLRDWEQTLAFLEESRPTMPVNLGEDGWREDTATGLWHGPNDAA